LTQTASLHFSLSFFVLLFLFPKNQSCAHAAHAMTRCVRTSNSHSNFSRFFLPLFSFSFLETPLGCDAPAFHKNMKKEEQ
jgi:hypothetical protein